MPIAAAPTALDSAIAFPDICPHYVHRQSDGAREIETFVHVRRLRISYNFSCTERMAAFLPEVYGNNTRRRVRRPCCRGEYFPGCSELSQNVRIGAAPRHVGGTQAA